MKKILFYGGAFLGSLVLINVGIFFFLNATQPKTALLAEADSTMLVDSLLADSSLVHENETALGPDSSAELANPHEIEHDFTVATINADSLNIQTPDIAQDEPEVAVAEPEMEPAENAEMTSQEAVATAMTGDPKQLAKLAKLMDGMKPNDSAAIASRLPVDTIVTLIMKMKDRSAAKMMASLPVEQAARVAIRMSELASSAPRPS